MKHLIEKYQCPGCVVGSDTECGNFQLGNCNECKSHCAGTMMMGAGILLLGMPKGFCRLGNDKTMKPWFYKHTADFHFDTFNIPAWKHLTEEGHILVRMYMPRVNVGALLVFETGDLDSINCKEITKEMMEGID